MSDDSQSCLVEKLSYYIDIDDTAEDQLASLEEHERGYHRHQEVYSEGDELKYLYVVKEGWFYSYTDMPDGRRQIVRVLHPGDIIGFPDIAFTEATCNVRASEDGCLCPFPKRKLDAIFKESPKLTALMFSIANRDHACVIDTLRAMGRMSARERLSYFFLDLISRLRITNKQMTDMIRMPMNQHEMGDALGLTHTYVSKTIREMEDEGLISRDGDTLTLEQEDRLKSMVDFSDRYAKLDTSWFPK
ncbi:Crp/Fnr family transcriptional regulator [Rhodophyticola sp.]|jgi:CRP-like cAMP-binding protein|uniref:Crp/Fnr family transcriptional regulator n=1 Tax=Rhodophyticola sp. TaxID=2680032 RepID=UPI003D2B4659